MFTIGGTIDDIDVLVVQGAALFVETPADTTRSSISPGRGETVAPLERLIASDDCLVLVARAGREAVAHLVGYIHAASPTRQPVTYATCAVVRRLRADDMEWQISSRVR
jgi:hypothetical protein